MRPRIRLLATILGVAVVAALFSRGAARTPPGPTAPPASAARPELPPGAEPEPGPPPLPDRNPFAYREGARGRTAPLSPSRPAPPEAVAPAADPEPAVRLTGFVHRGGRVHAAIVVPGGDVVLVGPGQEAAGYTMLSLDGEEGVRLRGPDGREIVLRLAP